jgi:hypothetical protein
MPAPKPAHTTAAAPPPPLAVALPRRLGSSRCPVFCLPLLWDHAIDLRISPVIAGFSLEP